jgi:lysophospholipase L1-like esterase
MPGIEGEIVFTVNKRGVRAPDFWPVSSSDRILCIGGSATECFYVTDEKSWPWLLGTKLSEKLGRRVLVANAGRSGHFTLHHIHQLRHYALADQFGLVVILCGINDAGTLLRDNYAARAATVPDEAFGQVGVTGAYYRYSFLVRAIEGLLLPRRKPSSDIVHQDPGGKWHAAARQERQQLLRTNTIRSAPPRLEAALGRYRADLVNIIDFCSARGQRLLFVTQPSLYRKDMPDDLAALLWHRTRGGAYTPEVLAEVLSAYNSTLVSVCRQFDVPCLDLAALLPKDTSVFYDDCHFNVSGCEAVATILCERLAENMGHKRASYAR